MSGGKTHGSENTHPSPIAAECAVKTGERIGMDRTIILKGVWRDPLKGSSARKSTTSSAIYNLRLFHPGH